MSSAPARVRWPLAAAIGVAVLAAIYGALWREGAQTMRRSIERFIENERSAGRGVSHSSISVSGFPLVLRGAVRDAAVGLSEEWRWSSEALFVEAAPWAPDRLLFSAGRTQLFDLGELGRWTVETTRGRAAIINGTARGWRLQIDAGPSRIRRDGAAQALAVASFAANIAPDARDPRAIAASFKLRALAAKGATRSVRAEIVEGSFTVSDAGPRRFLLERIHAEADGGSMTLSGSLALDAEGYPAGALDADIANPGVFAEALGELGAITPEDAEQAAAALSLAAIAGGGRIAAPLLLEDGAARIAGVAVAKLPKIDN